MSSNSTNADVTPEEVTQAISSYDDAGDPDNTSNLAHAELTASGAITPDAMSAEYSSMISVLSEQLRSLRASYTAALQDREDAENHKSLYSKWLDAEMAETST